MIRTLQTRAGAIRRRLQVPCPSKYGNKEVIKDHRRLEEFTSLRANETPLTEVQKAEEAHLRVRFDAFAASPELKCTPPARGAAASGNAISKS